MIGVSCNPPPSSPLAPSHWTAPSFSFSSHWTSRAGDELILVKYSWAREGLKIDQYIKLAVNPRWATVLSGRPPEDCGERERGEKRGGVTARERNRQQARHPPQLPSSSFLYKCCTRDGSCVLLHDSRPPALGGAGSDELPSFPFNCGFVLNVSSERPSHFLLLSAEHYSLSGRMRRCYK